MPIYPNLEGNEAGKVFDKNDYKEAPKTQKESQNQKVVPVPEAKVDEKPNVKEKPKITGPVDQAAKGNQNGQTVF